MRKGTKVIYLVVGLVLGFGAGLATGRASAPQPSWSETFGLELEGRPLEGPKDAAVVIVEFTDYECPFCRRYNATTYPALLEKYGDRVAYTVRHFPISYQHRHAHKAAQAAECAGDQGRFFQYHDVLFRNSQALDDASLVRYAAMLGLNTQVFQDCLESGAKVAVVDDDIQAGITRGLAGTPSFLINGRILYGAQPTEVFERAIERELGTK